MKYIEFPGTTLSVPSNVPTSQTLYDNNTNSYILIKGFSLQPVNVPAEADLPWKQLYYAVIVDPTGNPIDILQFQGVNINWQEAQIPVWNGTSSVLENGYIPVTFSQYMDHVGKSLIPPLCSLVLQAYSSTNATLTISGGWGLALSEEELILLLVRE